jgi:hypothetical protein
MRDFSVETIQFLVAVVVSIPALSSYTKAIVPTLAVAE